MKTKTVLWLMIALLGAIGLSIAFIDRPLALFIHDQLGGLTRAAGAFTIALEWIFAFEVSKYLYAFALLLIAAAFHLVDRGARRARAWYFVGSTLLLSRVISGTLKNVFERVRPPEFIKSREPADFFVDGGSSFPSGHSAFYFGLLFPVALLFPRLKWPVLLFAALAALSRVIELDHYLADILASSLVAALLTYAIARLLRVPTPAVKPAT
jgi:membrane-associated phospholipid phosphatase